MNMTFFGYPICAAPIWKHFRWAFSVVLILAYLPACTGGKYGFSKSYTPRKAEKPFFDAATEYPLIIAQNDPDEINGKLIAWFGIVQSIVLTDDGRHLVTLAHHTHQKRHLCRTETISSCRVTVHEKSSGTFGALLHIKPEEIAAGLDKIQKKSLLKVYGTVHISSPNNSPQNDQEQLTMDVEFYRHWPRRYYATTRASGTMRR